MTELKPEVKREAMIALCRQQNYPAACSCMAEGGIGFGKFPGALTCRDTYEEIIDVLAPILTRAAPRPDGDDGELVERTHEIARHLKGDYDGEFDNWANWIERAAARITALSAEVERLTASAKNNNQLARMYKAQADEFRAKYVAAVGQD